jgi:hypothetical protein
MARLLTKRLLQMMLVVFSGMLSLTALGAGQQIRITGGTNHLELPPSRQIHEFSRPSDFLGPRLQTGEPGYAPVLPPPGASSPILNRQVREYLDQKNNWIFQSPKTDDRDETLKRIFGVKEAEFSHTEKKPKSAVERYFESERNQKPAPGSDLTNKSQLTSESDSLNGLGSEGAFSFRDRPAGIIPELNPALLFNQNLAPDSLSRGVNEPRAFGLPQFGETISQPVTQVEDRERAQGQKDFERLLNPRQPTVGRWSDPINQQPDATRSILNPITARRPSALPSPSATQARAEDPLAMPSHAALTPRQDFLSPTRSLPIGGSSIAPALTAPQAPLVQPKPAVLEIPRPKF